MSSPQVSQHAAALVRRARAGDQNAMALIKKVGVMARSGSAKAKEAYAAIQKFIKHNPIENSGEAPNKGGPFGFGGSPSGIIPPAPLGYVQIAGEESASPQERQLPPLPKGALQHLFNPDYLVVTIVKAFRYRNGLDACAVVLASGPSLSADEVEEIGTSGFGSDATTQAFFMGVKFPLPGDLGRARDLDRQLKRAFLVGQCIGRAWRIQAVRRKGSRIGVWCPMAGWEMGEAYAVKPIAAPAAPSNDASIPGIDPTAVAAASAKKYKGAQPTPYKIWDDLGGM